MRDSKAEAPAYVFGDVVVDRAKFCVVKAGDPSKITPRAFEVLVYLIEHRDRVVEKQELFDKVWHATFVSDNALTRAIKEIRRVIGDDADAPSCIETVPKRGYRFIAALNSVTTAELSPLADSLVKAHDALNRYAWREARQYFETALREGDNADAFEGLAVAAWWLDDAEASLGARERAYLLYREQSNFGAAARVAARLAWDYATFRGDTTIANGWFRRGHRLLDNSPNGPDLGWLLAYRAKYALFYENQPDKARELSSEAAALGRAFGIADLELTAESSHGLALICCGDVQAGLSLLDEVSAALVAGEMSDITTIAQTACNLITGCERIRDYDRAAQWCRHFRELCERVENRSVFAVCRTQYAEVLMWHGQWKDAEAELTTATHDLRQLRPGTAESSILGLAKLRVRQGRLDEAQNLLGPLEHLLQAQCVIAELALERGDFETAIEACEKLLRRLSAEERIERANGLELLIRASVALGRLDAADEYIEELGRVVRRVGTKPLEASLHYSEGLIAELRPDHDIARQSFEDAVDIYRQCGATFECAIARISLARVLVKLERYSAALQAAQNAAQDLERIGADLLASRASSLAGQVRGAARLNSQT